MTLSTASAINDAFLTTLSAGSVLGNGQVSNDYGVMESTSACCCVVSWTNYRNEAMTFGNNRKPTWQFLLELKIKDQSDPAALNRNAIAAISNIITALQNDDTLQGTARGIGAVEATKDNTVVEEVNGMAWRPINITVEVQDWD